MQPAEVLPPKGVRQLQSTLHAFFQPRIQLPEDPEDTDAIPLARNSNPRERPPSPTVATHAVLVDHRTPHPTAKGVAKCTSTKP